jgi:radical SAM protein with 4Fe4S-binding SPASM domain
MSSGHITRRRLDALPLWKRMREKAAPSTFDLEITARCNNNCRHCYINLPAGDGKAAARELSMAEISALADEACSLGALWCLVTGGEPLLRPDFPEIYADLKKKGLLVSVFTNAALVTKEHVALFKRLPPHLLEVTVYGVTGDTYEGVTRTPGSFRAFERGLSLLLENGLAVRLKAMALRSNVHELAAIRDFCRARSRDRFRFDPQLHLRYDRNPARNAEILAERLTAGEIALLEREDSERFESIREHCEVYIRPELAKIRSRRLFYCAAGQGSFTIGHDGMFRLCGSLWHPDCLYDLRRGSLTEALKTFVPKVRKMSSNRNLYLKNCRSCPLMNLCLWCPAHAYLESGELDRPVEAFCRAAKARAAQIGKKGRPAGGA